MPCLCDGPEPEPTPVWKTIKYMSEKFDHLFKCHAEVVAERDVLLNTVALKDKEIEYLKSRLFDKGMK